MPITVADVDTLQRYIVGVMDKADHHANGVQDVCLAVAGAIIWKKDAGTTIEVFAVDGDMKNVLWVYVRGTRYAFSYHHPTAAIQIRRNTTQGPVLHSLTNQTPSADIREIFERL